MFIVFILKNRNDLVVDISRLAGDESRIESFLRPLAESLPTAAAQFWRFHQARGGVAWRLGIVRRDKKTITPFSTTSLQPGELVVMMGNPIEAASNKTRGIPSREAEDEDKLLYVVNYAWLKFPP